MRTIVMLAVTCALLTFAVFNLVTTLSPNSIASDVKAEEAQNVVSADLASSNPVLNAPNLTTTKVQDRLALELLEAVKTKNAARIDQLINGEHIGVSAFQEKGLTDQIEKHRANFRSFAIGSFLVQFSNDGASFQLLRHMETPRGIVSIYRYESDEGAFGYVWLEPELKANGEPIAKDIYTSTSGEWIGRSLFVRTKTQDKRLDSTLSKMNKVIATGKGGDQALAAFHQLPADQKSDRLFESLAIVVAEQVSDEAHKAELESYIRNHPNGLASDCYSLTLYAKESNLEKALAAIDRIEQKVKGDPYLELLRAQLHLEADDYSKAEHFIEAARKAGLRARLLEFTAIEAALAQGKFDVVGKRYQTLVEDWNLAIDLENLKDIEEFAEFNKSEAHKELGRWLKSREAAK